MTSKEFRAARLQLKLTQQELAERMGMASGRAIRRWENEESDIPGPAVRLMEKFTEESDHGKE